MLSIHSIKHVTSILVVYDLSIVKAVSPGATVSISNDNSIVY